MSNKNKGLNPVFGAAYPQMDYGRGNVSRTILFRMYSRILTEIALNRFTWQGLPPGMSGRFIERTLLFEGLVIWFWDDQYSRFFAMRGTGSGQVNFYDNPTEFRVIGNGMYGSKTLKPSECVPIWCNYMRIPETDVISTFASQLAEVTRTIDINLMQQRKPFVISAPQEQRLSIANAMKNVTDGEIAVLGSDLLNMHEAIQAFNTGIHPQLVTNTQLAKQKIWNEAMTLLGVNNANQDKRERLVADEVDANNEQVEASRGIALSSRLEACEAINAMYNLSVTCNYAPTPPSAGMDLGSPLDESEGSADA